MKMHMFKIKMTKSQINEVRREWEKHGMEGGGMVCQPQSIDSDKPFLAFFIYRKTAQQKMKRILQKELK